jgi:glutathione S-transferase
LSREEFGKIKETLPFGQIPILKVDDKKVLFQETAILRYVGRLVGLYPNDPEGAVDVDIALCCVDGMFLSRKNIHCLQLDRMKNSSIWVILLDMYLAFQALFWPEHPGKEIIQKKVIDERIPQVLGYLEKYLASKGTAFSAGNSLTIADLRIYSVIKFYKSGRLPGLSADLVDKYPHITKLYKAVESHDKLSS